MALCVRRRGRVVLDRSMGHVVGNAPGDPADAHRVVATPATLFNLFSASKMVTAMLVHLCDQRGLVHLDDPVAHYIPEFGAHGKHRITLRHVLSHRAGIPHIPPDVADPGLLERPDEVLRLLCEQKPTWAPGRRLAYHALTGGFVLAAVIERVTGKDVRALLRDEILAPLGFDAFNYGVPAARMPEVAHNAFTGPPLVPPLRQLIRRALSVDFVDAVRISNDPRFLTSIVPAGNVIATANEASRFMQLLLGGGELDGVRIFEPRTLTHAVAEQSYLEVDLTLGAPIRYSMGFMLGGRAGVYGVRHAARVRPPRLHQRRGLRRPRPRPRGRPDDQRQAGAVAGHRPHVLDHAGHRPALPARRPPDPGVSPLARRGRGDRPWLRPSDEGDCGQGRHPGPPDL